MLFNTVNSLEQCGQQNIVQYCFHKLGTSCSFFAVYIKLTREPSEFLGKWIEKKVNIKIVFSHFPIVPHTALSALYH